MATTVTEAVPVPATTTVLPRDLPWLTLERALYGLLLFVAAGLRLGDLGRWPLLGTEAGTALDSWRFSQGAVGSVIGHSPLVFHGNLLTFALFGSGDVQARFVTALFGTLLVALPYLLRSVLGRSGALMTALFLAISPTLLYFSRQDTSQVVAATCALALLAGVALFGQSEDRRGLYLAAVAFGLGLTSGPSFYTYLFLWGIFLVAVVVAMKIVGPSYPPQSNLQGGKGKGDVAPSSHPRKEARGGKISNLFFVLVGIQPLNAAASKTESGEHTVPVGKLLVIAAVTFFLVSTAFLLDWSGLQAAVALAGDWVHRLWRVPSGLFSWSYYLSLLALYEPAVLLFGLVGIVAFAREKSLQIAFATVWFVGALLLYGTLGGVMLPSDLVVIILPLILVAGGTAGRLLDAVAERGTWETEGAYLGLASPIFVFVLLNVAAYANAGSDRSLELAAVGLSTVVVILILFGYWAGTRAAVRAAGLALLLFLTMGQMRSAWNLSLERADNPAEPMIVEATSPDVHHMADVIANLSNERLQQRGAIAIAYHESLGPLVGWYLRSFRNVRTITQYDVQNLPPVVITPFSNNPPPLGQDYIGQRIHLQRLWHKPDLRGSERARWLLYRDVTTGYVDMDAILFVQVPK